MAFTVECNLPWLGRAHAQCRTGSSYGVTLRLLQFWDTERKKGQGTSFMSAIVGWSSSGPLGFSQMGLVSLA
jgi:hypothetical protein